MFCLRPKQTKDKDLHNSRHTCQPIAYNWKSQPLGRRVWFTLFDWVRCLGFRQLPLLTPTILFPPFFLLSCSSMFSFTFY